MAVLFLKEINKVYGDTGREAFEQDPLSPNKLIAEISRTHSLEELRQLLVKQGGTIHFQADKKTIITSDSLSELANELNLDAASSFFLKVESWVRDAVVKYSVFVSQEISDFFKKAYNLNTTKFQNNFLRNMTELEQQVLDGLTAKEYDAELVMVRFYEHKYKLALDRLIKKISKCNIDGIERLSSLATIYNEDILNELTY